MGKINKLDESVYNRLAAGEVIENPASIVKELVENSIDAGASKIKIIIENGGKKLISVHDNGSGIAEDDLLLSLESHATSKLLDFNDLSTIATLGFRGEALASILAVSEIEIKTKTINDENANVVIGKGGKILNRTISNREVGTSITVTNLFYNTQARWRFLKNEKGEEANITKLVSELIISNPDISFEYNVDGKQIYLSLGYGFNEAVKTIMGNKIFDNLLPIAKELNDYKLTGFIAIPSTNAIISNKTKQIFIVNGRLFNDLSISPVIQNAYNERLMKRIFPIIILDIIVPFDEIDINVSPNKREVRFSNKNLLHSLIYSAIKDTLIKYENSKNESILMELNGKSNNNVDSEQHFSFDSNIENESTTSNFLQNDIIINKNLFVDNNKDSIDKNNNINSEFNYVPSKQENKLTNTTIFDKYKNSNVDYNKEESQIDKNNVKIIGQIFDTYIIIEVKDAIYFIDQHAAHERILYEKFIKESQNKLHVQKLLVPFTKELNQYEVDRINNVIDNINKMGFSMKLMDNKLIIDEVPNLFVDINLDEFFNSIINSYSEIKSIEDIEIIHEKYAMLACKSAIKGNQKYDGILLDNIIKYLIENNMKLQCPHGRPTILKMKKNDIEKMFFRIVK